jgi:hypothetical protein
MLYLLSSLKGHYSAHTWSSLFFFLSLIGPFPVGFHNNSVLWGRVNPTPNPQPGGSRFYIGVYSPGDTLCLAPPLRLSSLGDPAGSYTTAGIASSFLDHAVLPAWPYMGLHKSSVPWGGTRVCYWTVSWGIWIYSTHILVLWVQF